MVGRPDVMAPVPWRIQGRVAGIGDVNRLTCSTSALPMCFALGIVSSLPTSKAKWPPSWPGAGLVANLLAQLDGLLPLTGPVRRLYGPAR